MSNSIFITGTKEIFNQKNVISDTINKTYNSLDETLNIDIDTNNEGYFSWIFSKYTIFFIIIIVIVIFVLHNNDITIDYIIKYFVYGSGETIKQTVGSSLEGVKSTLDTTDKTINNAVNIIEKSVGINTDNDNIYNKSNNKYNNEDIDIDLHKLNTKLIKKPKVHIPEPDDTTNNIKKKSGYCYIGEDRGFRSCVKVSEHDTCMSGDIFPTRDICINPNLRH